MFTISLAPIRGITDSTMRSALARHFGGIDSAVAPFIRLGRQSTKANLLRDLDPSRNQQLTVVPQILGNDPDQFLSVASRLIDLGYPEVNWNLGCPFPTAIKKIQGAGLLAEHNRIIDFLDRVMPALALSLSIKTRLGLSQPTDLGKLLPKLDDYPLKEIIIHPRTAKQVYDGQVDLERFAEALGCTKHAVVYNGDITSSEIAKDLADRFPNVGGWMIGRGLLTNPHLGQEIKTGSTLTVEEGARKVRLFHDDLYSSYRQQQSGPAHFLDKMKGIWSYLGYFIGADRKFFKKLRKIKKVSDYDRLVAEALEKFSSQPT